MLQHSTTFQHTSLHFTCQFHNHTLTLMFCSIVMITNKNTQTKVDYYKIIRANEDYGVRYSGEESKINWKGIIKNEEKLLHI